MINVLKTIINHPFSWAWFIYIFIYITPINMVIVLGDGAFMTLF